jgi:uncharacterized protein YbaA (DUF1428 family)
VGEDLDIAKVMSFPRGIRARKGETVVFSWIVYRSKAQRNRVNAGIMKDPRILRMMKKSRSPFDPARMLYGGFTVFVDLR